MATAPPARTDLADTYPNPSNAQFRTGIGKLWDTLFGTGGLLGSAGTGSVADARAALGIGSAISFRNLLINAGGWFNQRGYVSGGAVGAVKTYTLDRWRVVVSGQSLVFGAASPDRTMTAPAGGVEQAIPGASIEGGVYALSWQGSATATVNGVAVANGGSTASLPANTDVIVRFSAGTVLLPQFEKGTVATPFERRLPRVELMLCREFFRAFPIGVLDFIGNNSVAAQNNSYTVPLGEPMRLGVTPNFLSTWTATNVGAITASVLTAENITLNAPNTVAGQWRITNSSVATISSEIP